MVSRLPVEGGIEDEREREQNKLANHGHSLFTIISFVLQIPPVYCLL